MTGQVQKSYYLLFLFFIFVSKQVSNSSVLQLHLSEFEEKTGTSARKVTALSKASCLL